MNRWRNQWSSLKRWLYRRGLHIDGFIPDSYQDIDPVDVKYYVDGEYITSNVPVQSILIDGESVVSDSWKC